VVSNLNFNRIPSEIKCFIPHRFYSTCSSSLSCVYGTVYCPQLPLVVYRDEAFWYPQFHVEQQFVPLYEVFCTYHTKTCYIQHIKYTYWISSNHPSNCYIDYHDKYCLKIVFHYRNGILFNCGLIKTSCLGNT
jgi:hypothetical protein